MEEYKFYCEKCKYGTNIRHSLLQHNESNFHKTGKITRKEEKVNYKCDKCDFNSVNKNNYVTHHLNNHSTKEERKEKFKYYCDKCDFGVFTESSLKLHQDSVRHKRYHTVI
jgi:Zn finger protein HypA/HybF involved in hydrogenase expression